MPVEPCAVLALDIKAVGIIGIIVGYWRCMHWASRNLFNNYYSS